jgi:hypothetical protein
MKAPVLTIALFLGAGVCVSAGEIIDLYQKQEGRDAYRPREEVVKAKEPGAVPAIDEIGIARSGGCYGSECYDVIIRADGRVRWFGKRGVARKGNHQGRLREYPRRLLQLVAEANLFDLPTKYHRGVVDGTSTYLYVKVGDRKRVIWCRNDEGPAVLWAIAALVDDALENAVWGDPTKQEALKKSLGMMWVQSFRCKDMPISKAFALLHEKSAMADPNGEGVKFTFTHPVEGFGQLPERKITLTFTNMFLLDALEVLTRVSGLSYRVDDSSVAIIGDCSDWD